MNGTIVIFIMPSEVEDLALTLYNLKRSSIFRNTDNIKLKVDIGVCLSDEVTDWSASKLSQDYVKGRVTELCLKYLNWCEYDLFFEYGAEVLGCDTFRKRSWKSNINTDFFIWLDCDMIFPDSSLQCIENTFETIKSNGYDDMIITPQIIKHWDSSWNIISNSLYANHTFDDRMKLDVYTECISQNSNSGFYVTQLDTFKFAGGWFTLISKSLLDKIGIPDSFGHYGALDTFIQICASIMKQNGHAVSQYVIMDLVVSELYNRRCNEFISTQFVSIGDKNEFSKPTKDNFTIEIQNFRKRWCDE